MSYARDTRPPQARFLTALFTWNGRMNRITYVFWFLLTWVVLAPVALIVAVSVAAGVAAAIDPRLLEPAGSTVPNLQGHPVLQLPTLIMGGYALLAIIGSSALMTKRLRDAGWPAWIMPLAFLCLGLPVAIGPLGYGGMLGWLAVALMLMWPQSQGGGETPASPAASTHS